MRLSSAIYSMTGTISGPVEHRAPLDRAGEWLERHPLAWSAALLFVGLVAGASLLSMPFVLEWIRAGVR